VRVLVSATKSMARYLALKIHSTRPKEKLKVCRGESSTKT
jgi:hypothetical protein